jgi:hypothetical protein
VKKLWMLWLVSLLLGGCKSDPTGPRTDSNTNWLRCDSTSACGTSAACVCGICAEPCDAAECAERGGSCVSAEEQSCVADEGAAEAYCLPLELSRSSWTATASSSNLMNEPGDLLYNPPENALDGELSTRWSSGKPQAGDEWFQVDFGGSVTVSGVVLDMGEDASVQSYLDYARGYSVSVSDVSEDLAAPALAEGEGLAPLTDISLPGARAATGRYLLIRQTAEATDWWSIHELRASVRAPNP